MLRNLRIIRAVFVLATAVLVGGGIWLSGHEQFAVSFRGAVSAEPYQWDFKLGGPGAFIQLLNLHGANGTILGIDLEIPVGANEQVLRTYAYLSEDQLDQRVAKDTLRVTQTTEWDSAEGSGRTTLVNWHDQTWWVLMSSKVTNAGFSGHGRRSIEAQFSPDTNGPNVLGICNLTARDSTALQPQLEVTFAVIESNGWRIGPERGKTVIPLPAGIQARCRLPANPQPPFNTFSVSIDVDGYAVDLAAGTSQDGYLWHSHIPGVLSVGARQIDVSSSSRIEYRGPAIISMSPGFAWEWNSNGYVKQLRLNDESVLPRRFTRYIDVLGFIGFAVIFGGWAYLLRLAFPRSQRGRRSAR